VAEKTDIQVDQSRNRDLNPLDSPIDSKGTNQAINILINEGGESFYKYVDWLGLANDPDLVVLSSLHHYYYDADEMNKVKTVINLKELNQIKQIESFLDSSFQILPQKSNFIGCFIDNKKINGYVLRNSSSSNHKNRSSDDIENSIVSRIPFLNMLYSIMDSKTNKFMSRKSVSLLLEEHGSKVMNMTEQNGITYFHAQKVQTKGN